MSTHPNVSDTHDTPVVRHDSSGDTEVNSFPPMLTFLGVVTAARPRTVFQKGMPICLEPSFRRCAAGEGSATISTGIHRCQYARFGVRLVPRLGSISMLAVDAVEDVSVENARWTLRVDLGREKGTSMPAEWAKSGARETSGPSNPAQRTYMWSFPF